MSEAQNTVGLPLLNAPAPNFSAKTTHGDRSVADYKGQWLVLFSHPSNFTPVCTTEFIGFAGVAAELKARNCELLGMSIESLFSHIAWTRNIAEKFGVEIPFAIIEDPKIDVARAYGMIHEGASGTSAVRATFIIDPEGVLRAMLYYPMGNGRSIPEIVRPVTAMQASDANGVATPVGWQPGDDAIVSPPRTIAAANAREGEGFKYSDWYFSSRPLAA